MFKLPEPPSPQADPHELADFVELLCWHRGSASERDIVAYLGQVDDNDDNSGCDDDDDQNSEALAEVMNEIERRENACGSGYPFQLALEGTVLRHNGDENNHRSMIYNYLLMSTRLNMKGNNSVHANIDGCLLFEELCAHVLKNYLGGDRARSLVFGTASTGSFQDKVKTLCKELNEGSGFRNPNVAPVQDKDGRLDVVAWVPFSDRSVGQLIVFSQCKTGTNWKDQTNQLHPDAFIKKWIDGCIAANPVRSFCVSEACNRARWNSMCIDAGLLLDRCRLVDFCDGIDKELFAKITLWTTNAKNTIDWSKY